MAIELSNLRFHYPGRSRQATLDVPFWSLPTGAQAFVHGPSGGGKSTLLSVLGGLLPVCAGHITVLGQRLDTMTGRQRDRFRAKHIGYVLQQFNLIPYLNAFDNTLLATHFAQRKKTPALLDQIAAMLTALNLSEQNWHTPARNLSVGQQQRVAIARALINKPELLIADEPTSSLDAANRDAFMTLLMSMVADNGITLVFVSHDQSLARYFDRVEAFADINRVRDAV